VGLQRKSPYDERDEACTKKLWCRKGGACTQTKNGLVWKPLLFKTEVYTAGDMRIKLYSGEVERGSRNNQRTCLQMDFSQTHI